MGPDSTPPFAWVFSQSTILKQWESGDFDKLNSEFHIDNLCHQQALQSPDSNRDYFIGRAELSQHGRIVDPDALKAYTKAADNLTRQVLQSRGVVFSTLATSQAPVLYKQDPASGELLWHYRASTIICDEAGTVLRPHLLIAVMSFISATRLVCAGDGKQLPAFMKSIVAQQVWGATCYMDQVRWVFPWSLLTRMMVSLVGGSLSRCSCIRGTDYPVIQINGNAACFFLFSV